MIKYASQNRRSLNLVQNELHNFYPRFRVINPILPNIQNITWEQFVILCHMIDKAEHFLINGGQLNHVPVRDTFVDMTQYTLDLSSRNLTDEMLILFFALLLHVNDLQYLNLSSNQINDITPLQNAFQNKPNLPFTKCF